MYHHVHMVPVGFDWDEGNREKNWSKHRVRTHECEQMFFNRPIMIWKDSKHSETEERFAALGKTNEGRRLAVVFTIRGGTIRVISAQEQNKKERRAYEEVKS